VESYKVESWKVKNGNIKSFLTLKTFTFTNFQLKKENMKIEKFEDILYWQKGSCGEVRSMLFLAHDLGKINEKEFNSFLQTVSGNFKTNIRIN
jgi:hypothetical protein